MTELSLSVLAVTIIVANILPFLPDDKGRR